MFRLLSLLVVFVLVSTAKAETSLLQSLPKGWVEDRVTLPFPFEGSSTSEIIFAARELDSPMGHRGEVLLFPVSVEGELPAGVQLIEEISKNIKAAYDSRVSIEKPGPGKEDLSLREESLDKTAKFFEFFQLYKGEERFCQVLVRKVSDKTAHVMFVTYRPNYGPDISREDLSNKLEPLFHQFVEGPVQTKPEGIRFVSTVDKHQVCLSLTKEWKQVSDPSVLIKFQHEPSGCELFLVAHSASDFDTFVESRRKELGALRSDTELGLSNTERIHAFEKTADGNFSRILYLQGKPVGKFFCSTFILEFRLNGPAAGRKVEDLQQLANILLQKLQLRAL